MFARTPTRSLRQTTRLVAPLAMAPTLVLAGLSALALVGPGSPSGATAQGGTPAAASVPAADCRVEPRVVTAWDGTPAAGVEIPPVTTDGPFVPPTGQTPDAGTVAAVTATITESLACANAGDVPRLLALASDRFVRALFTGDAAAPEAEVLASISAPATPVATADLLTLIAIGPVVLLDDGRIAATVSTRDQTVTYVDVVYLVNGGDRWLIDDSVAIDSSTQVPASPTATP